MVKKTVTKKRTHKSQALKTENTNVRLKLWHKLSIGALVVTLTASLFAVAPQTHSSSTTVTPLPTQVATTPYGEIGKWMLTSSGQISNWGGQKYQNKTLLEAVNVIIVDPTSKSAEESKAKLNTKLSKAGFPPRFGHSAGFKGIINGQTYKQQPTGLNAYSDKTTFVQNNHGRMFGPSPVPSGGYVWSGAFSTEKPVYYLWFILGGHAYVSSNVARDALANGLVASGNEQFVNVDLANAYDTTTATTGDHNGEAVVIVLK